MDIYGNMDPINIPSVLAYIIPAPWIRHGMWNTPQSNSCLLDLLYEHVQGTNLLELLVLRRMEYHPISGISHHEFPWNSWVFHDMSHQKHGIFPWNSHGIAIGNSPNLIRLNHGLKRQGVGPAPLIGCWKTWRSWCPWLLGSSSKFRVPKNMSTSQIYSHPQIDGEVLKFIELDYGTNYRKALYLMVKTMVSCRFSLKPIQW